MRSDRLLAALVALAAVALFGGTLLAWREISGHGGLAVDAPELVAAYGRAAMRLAVGAGLGALLLVALGLVAARRVARDLDWPTAAWSALGVASVLLLVRGAETATSGLLALAVVLSAGAAGLSFARRLVPGASAWPQIALVLAPVGALVLAMLASALRLQAAALAGAGPLNEYARIDRLVGVAGASRRVALGALLALVTVLVATGLLAVRRRMFAGVPAGRLGIGLALLAVLWAGPLGVLGVLWARPRSAAEPKLKGLALPLLRQAGRSLGAVPLVIMRLDDGFIDVKLPPAGTPVVELAVDGRHEFKVMARLLEKLLEAGVKKVRPVYAYPLPEALRPHIRTLAWLPLVRPLLPPGWVTFRTCEVGLQRVANASEKAAEEQAEAKQAAEQKAARVAEKLARQAAAKASQEAGKAASQEAGKAGQEAGKDAGKPAPEPRKMGRDDRVAQAVERRPPPPELYTPPPGRSWADVALRLGQLELIHCRLSKREPVLGF